MNKPANYDEAIAKTGEFEDLPNGAYKCVIKKAAQAKSKNNEDMLELYVDILSDADNGGEYKDYFKKQYDGAIQSGYEAKWRGTLRQITSGKSVPFFKGLITSIERSNPGYTFNFDENTLTGKKICGVFRHRQYKAQDGTLKLAVECWYLCDINKVKDIKTPENKLLNDTNGVKPQIVDDPKFEELSTDEDLPF